MKLLLADDHHVVRKGLVYFLESSPEIKVVAEAGNGEEAIRLYVEHQPDVLLMDIDMPVLSGIDATKEILRLDPKARILILTSFSDQETVIPALQAGAQGYQLKDVAPDMLLQTIHAVHDGENAVHPSIMKHVLTHVAKPGNKIQQKLRRLTEREREVLSEISTGRSNKEIADVLVISEKTVKTHVSNVLGKLELHDRTQAALFAIQAGVARPSVF
ncbi:response regulator [Shouchella shacheensis]|uniref:response regulator n=1 Tax=Shouchella shacheensis TaxID=1649580 RepID=UPI00073FC6AA|nr:response regulator transcription factor [Shouchella shacheensis]